MNKTFKKTLLVAAVAALSASASMASETGKTNLMFPYVSSGANAYTFLTISNGGTQSTAATVHFIYGMKATTATNATGCEHGDGNGTLTANDVLQFEMSNKLNLVTALANGDTNNSFPWTGGADKAGFLLLNNDGPAPIAGQNSLYGSAVVVDTASGLRLAYSTQGFNTDSSQAPDYTINNTGVAGGPEPLNGATPTATGLTTASLNHQLTWYATPTVSTSWFVIPLGTEALMSPSSSVGGVTGSFSMTSSDGATGGAYDMKEAFSSGALSTTVTCYGTITRDLMLQSTALANSAKGGMASLATTVTTASSGGVNANKAMVFQNQSTTAINGSATNFINRAAHR
ncbi:MAG: hypothetical protein V4858_11765 [Pseudomonadota bacterium]